MHVLTLTGANNPTIAYGTASIANSFTFGDSTAYYMTINTSTSRVGIGLNVTAPAHQLSVANNFSVGAQGGTDIVYITGGAGYGALVETRYADGSINNALRGNGNTALNIFYGSTGIGTTTPVVKLDVVGAVKTSRLGYYGTYDSTQVQGIWSITEAYGISTGSNNFGNQYGLCYGHVNAGVGSKQPLAGFEHQILFTWDGFVNASISLAGYGYFKESIGIGVNPTVLTAGSSHYKKLTIVGSHSDTVISLHSLGNGTTATSSTLTMWASEPNISYTGAGIGHNINTHLMWGRIINTLGQAYIRFDDGNTSFVNTATQNLNGSNPQMYISRTGQVCINNTASTARLHIAIDSAFVDYSNYGKGIQITGTPIGRQQIGFIRAGITVVSLGYAASGNNRFGFGGGTIDDASFVPNYLNVVSGGKVLIGSITERVVIGTAVLEVEGAILQRGVVATTNPRVLGADTNGTIVAATAASISDLLNATNTGSGDYIKNQTAATQGASFKIGGTGFANAFFATGNVTSGSDRKLKTNIVNLTNIYEKVKDLNLKQYIKFGKNEIGYIAQDVQHVFPEMVENHNGTLGLNYGSIGAVALQLGKETRTEVELLKERITLLELKLDKYGITN